MKSFLLLLVAIGSAGAQQQGTYYDWSTSYGPVVSALSPTGYTNELVQPGMYAPEISSQAFCVNSPFPNAFIQFGFEMTTACPEGAYISEDGSNGVFPPDGYSMWNTMLQNGVVIDAADSFTQLEIWQWDYSCGAYYVGPTYDYDDFLNPCVF